VLLFLITYPQAGSGNPGSECPATTVLVVLQAASSRDQVKMKINTQHPYPRYLVNVRVCNSLISVYLQLTKYRRIISYQQHELSCCVQNACCTPTAWSCEEPAMRRRREQVRSSSTRRPARPGSGTRRKRTNSGGSSAATTVSHTRLTRLGSGSRSGGSSGSRDRGHGGSSSSGRTSRSGRVHGRTTGKRGKKKALTVASGGSHALSVNARQIMDELLRVGMARVEDLTFLRRVRACFTLQRFVCRFSCSS